MDFCFTKEQEKLRERVTDFANQVVAPLAHIVDTTGQIPSEIIEKAVGINLLGLAISKAYGGSGLGYIGLVIAIEEIARVCASTALVIASHQGPAEAISLFGSPQQKKDYLVPLALGKHFGAFAATETGAGSDVSASVTYATQSGDNWIINGRKIFVTNASQAGMAVITAITEDSRRQKERLSLLIVPSGLPGFTIGSKYNKLGMRGVSTHEIFFDDCQVPLENLIGTRGAGYSQLLELMSRHRIFGAAVSIGIAHVCLESSLSYAKRRIQFGQPLAKFQAIRFKLADMATQLELARLMAYKAAWLVDNNKPHRRESAMAKLFASEIASQAANQAIQIHGGAAYTTDFPQERYLRDAKLMEIAEGTSEMLRITIAKQLGC
ncbi:MAG TPA: acyl-CoA dehydrogenase family protein [Negativicutes bacterium]|jgi:alkylation response protein AidB-like acyl-CoA dehydrogenase